MRHENIRVDIGKKEEYFMMKPRDSISKDRKLRLIEPDNINKDSLKITCRPYSRYKNFVRQIIKEGWNYMEDVQSHSLTHLSTNTVITYALDKDYYGEFLNIGCHSQNHMITICGFDDSGVDPMDFYNHSNLYKIPHFFSITCTDDGDKELSPDTIIDIFKIETNKKHKRLCKELYCDLSQHKDGRFKRKEERYYFYESIKLCNHEMLSFRTQSPDIDIKNIKLFMRADIFEKET